MGYGLRERRCGSERGCYTDFLNDCIKTPFTTLPAINIHSSGDWYVSDLAGHCGQGSSWSSSQKRVDHRWVKEYVPAVKETAFDQSDPSGSEGPQANKATDTNECKFCQLRLKDFQSRTTHWDKRKDKISIRSSGKDQATQLDITDVEMPGEVVDKQDTKFRVHLTANPNALVQATRIERLKLDDRPLTSIVSTDFTSTPAGEFPRRIQVQAFDAQATQAFWNFTTGACVNSPANGMCGGGADWGNYFSTGCWTGLGLFGGSLCDRSTTFKNRCYQYEGDYDTRYCVCTGCGSCGGSPILVDVPGGFEMTDVAHGVRFDLNSIGGLDRVSWTSPTSTAAWLVLDRNRDGYITNGKELFGNFTFQSEPLTNVEKNGFLALAEWDKPENGGNGDSKITKDDDVFRKLRLWRDANQNGLSDPGELHGLWEYGIETVFQLTKTNVSAFLLLVAIGYRDGISLRIPEISAGMGIEFNS